MKKLKLCLLSFFWMASCLGSEKPISDEITSSVPCKEEFAGSAENTNGDENIEPVSTDKTRTDQVFLEEKAAYFHPVNGKIRDIYASGMGLYGFELSFPTWRYIYGWASGSYMSHVGHSIGEHSRTRVQLVPLGIGIKFVYTVSCFDLYAGIGGLGTYFHTKDQSHFVISSTSKWAAGGIAKVGIFIHPAKSFFIDLFGDYSYMKFDFHNGNKKVVRHNVDFSGWSVGGGLGWLF